MKLITAMFVELTKQTNMVAMMRYKKKFFYLLHRIELLN